MTKDENSAVLTKLVTGVAHKACTPADVTYVQSFAMYTLTTLMHCWPIHGLITIFFR